MLEIGALYKINPTGFCEHEQTVTYYSIPSYYEYLKTNNACKWIKENKNNVLIFIGQEIIYSKIYKKDAIIYKFMFNNEIVGILPDRNSFEKIECAKE